MTFGTYVRIASTGSVLLLVFALSLHAQQTTFLIQLKTEQDPTKRSEKALTIAEEFFRRSS